MTDRKRTAPPPDGETPVLYYTGTGTKVTVPERDLYPADLAKRSRDALIATGFYSDTKPKARP